MRASSNSLVPRAPAKRRGVPWGLNPLLALFGGIGAHASLLLIAPVAFQFTMTLESVLYIIACVLAFSLGYYLQSLSHRRTASSTWEPTRSQIALVCRATLALAFVGVLARLFDRYGLRGVSLAETTLANRDVLAGGFSAFSVFAGVLFPFSMLPLFVALAFPDRVSSTFKVLATTLFFFPSFDSLAIGGRTLAIMNISLFMLALVAFRRIRLTARGVLALSVVGVAVIWLSYFVFESRLDEFELDFLESAIESVFGYTVAPSQRILTFITWAGSDTLLGGAAKAALHISQYLVHGIFEFSLLLANYPPGDPHSWGGAMFFPIYKAVSFFMASGPIIDISQDLSPRVGVFQSFFGPLFLDFGWGGPMFMAGYGFLSGVAWQRARVGSLPFVPLSLFNSFVLFWAMEINFFQSGMGVYVLSAFSCFAALVALTRSAGRGHTELEFTGSGTPPTADPK